MGLTDCQAHLFLTGDAEETGTKNSGLYRSRTIIPGGRKSSARDFRRRRFHGFAVRFRCAELDIHCAHINHQLRGDEAQRDEDFVD